MKPPRPHRWPFLAASAVLLAFSVWCLVVALRVNHLRTELAHTLYWSEEVATLRGKLETIRRAQPATLERRAVPSAERYRALWEELSATADGELQVAAQRLQLAVQVLVAASGEAVPEADALWDASVGALAAAGGLEDALGRRVQGLHQRLGAYWTSLNLLVLASLVLAGSTLAFLRLALDRRARLEAAHRKAVKLASRDPLTGVWNREAILGLLRTELTRSARLELPVGVMLFDLDNFRAVNDLLGQDQGDDVLRQVAERVRQLVRPYDTLGRYTGDAFLVMLPACDDAACAIVGRRLRNAINDHDIEHGHGRIRITMTLALAAVERPGETDLDSLIRGLRDDIEAQRAARRAAAQPRRGHVA